jgi:uncharacterized protein YhbP (UPF0306 family)
MRYTVKPWDPEDSGTAQGYAVYDTQECAFVDVWPDRASARRYATRLNGARNVDATLLRMAETVRKLRGSESTRDTRRVAKMHAGKAYRLITDTYSVDSVRESVWEEFRKLAGLSTLSRSN